MSAPTDFETARQLIGLKHELKGRIASLRENQRQQADFIWELGKTLERLRTDFLRERDGGDGTEEEDEAWRAVLGERGFTQDEYDEFTLFTAHHPDQSPSKTMTPDQVGNLIEILTLRPLLRAKTESS